MAADVIELGGPETRVRVEGLGRTLRQLAKAGAEAEDMRDLMHELGTIVVLAAGPMARRGETGKLAASPRAGRGKTKAVVRAGGRRVPYAGVQHYGWPAHNITPNPFLTNALAATRPAVLAALDDGLAKLLADADLT